jgi:hypothetical protein
MSHTPAVPLALPTLPPAAGAPWSAEIVNAHQGLTSTFRISRAALNLDESDPIRLGHHLERTEVFMSSIVEVLASHTINPLPRQYIDELRSTVSTLAKELQQVLQEAKTVFAQPSYFHPPQLMWSLTAKPPKSPMSM